MLFAYILEPFLRAQGEPVSPAHTHHAESLQIARTWLDLGFDVDVIDYRNDSFRPEREYQVLVSARTQFDRLATLMPRHCLKIAHLDTAHFVFNNQAAYARSLDLQRRRGVTCTSLRLIEHNRAIENADCGAVLGNEHTRATYAYAGKPLYCLPVPTVTTYPEQVQKDYEAAKRRFLWFGSGGLVHKGLDLVLEAFAGMPDLELWVCGPLADEQEFVQIYRRELYETPNIHAVGWVDVTQPQFLDIADRCIALIYPSCAEGQSASSVTCMQAGLIPLLTPECGIDLHDFGIALRGSSVEEIRETVRRVAGMSAQTLRETSGRAQAYARTHHTLDSYSERYRAMVAQLLPSR